VLGSVAYESAYCEVAVLGRREAAVVDKAEGTVVVYAAARREEGVRTTCVRQRRVVVVRCLRTRLFLYLSHPFFFSVAGVHPAPPPPLLRPPHGQRQPVRNRRTVHRRRRRHRSPRRRRLGHRLPPLHKRQRLQRQPLPPPAHPRPHPRRRPPHPTDPVPPAPPVPAATLLGDAPPAPAAISATRRPWNSTTPPPTTAPSWRAAPPSWRRPRRSSSARRCARAHGRSGAIPPAGRGLWSTFKNYKYMCTEI